MSKSLVMTLIRKDWDLWKKAIIGTLGFGILGLAIVVLGKSQFSFIAGGILLITSLIILGCILVQAGIAVERKEQSLAFIMSLPVTTWEYSWAKIIFCLSSYLVVWALLIAAASYIVLGSPIPDGMMALFLPMFLELPCLLVLMMAVALVSESMEATVVVMTACNIGFNLLIFAFVRIPDIGRQMASATLEMTPQIYALLGAELLFIVVTLALTLYLQSRKTDFI